MPAGTATLRMCVAVCGYVCVRLRVRVGPAAAHHRRPARAGPVPVPARTVAGMEKVPRRQAVRLSPPRVAAALEVRRRGLHAHTARARRTGCRAAAATRALSPTSSSPRGRKLYMGRRLPWSCDSVCACRAGGCMWPSPSRNSRTSRMASCAQQPEVERTESRRITLGGTGKLYGRVAANSLL